MTTPNTMGQKPRPIKSRTTRTPGLTHVSDILPAVLADLGIEMPPPETEPRIAALQAELELPLPQSPRNGKRIAA